MTLTLGLRCATVAMLALPVLATVGCGTSENDSQRADRGTTNQQSAGNRKSGAASRAPRSVPSGSDKREQSQSRGTASHKRPPGPKTPTISARRIGQDVAIRYLIPPTTRGKLAPWLLVTSVDSRGDRFPPLTTRHELHGRLTGTIRQPLGAGRPPYRVFVEVLARSGLRSSLVVVAVR
jgi:hypothetical protein